MGPPTLSLGVAGTAVISVPACVPLHPGINKLSGGLSGSLSVLFSPEVLSLATSCSELLVEKFI
jgi:hypothetical protein